jgi:large subunit ribosomal protein L6
MPSRIAKQPVEIVKGVSVELGGDTIAVKGPKGNLSMDLNSEVRVRQEGEQIQVVAASGSRFANAIAGTMRALIQNSLRMRRPRG